MEIYRELINSAKSRIKSGESCLEDELIASLAKDLNTLYIEIEEVENWKEVKELKYYVETSRKKYL